MTETCGPLRKFLCLIGWHIWTDQTWAEWRIGPPDVRCDFCKKVRR